MNAKIRLGDLLVQNNVITASQLQHALEKQKQTGGKLGKVLIEEDFIKETQLLQFLSQQLGLPYINLKNYQFEKEFINLLPESYARRFRALVLEEEAGKLLVGMADPLDIFARDEIERVLGRTLQIAIVKEEDLLKSLDLVYRRTEAISSFAEELDTQFEEVGTVDFAQIAANADDSDMPVVRLLQSIFEDAGQIQASDIHIEPGAGMLRIRQRVDGVLQEQIVSEARIAEPLTLRLKLMANLNISERRLPQDGRFNIKIRDKDFDVRISTVPTQYGESTVMRLLDQGTRFSSLDHTGMTTEMITQIRRMLHLPHGMFLVTGPTGSGKTTTLYSALTELNKPESKIITVEDPVEYRLERLNQIQVEPKLDLSFARVLRSMLRQDPDIIMVGEIRDQETAEIAMRAALTGHLVLATLHTNDAASTAIRLLDMGVKGYIVAASLRGILAQRLVRKICEQCKTPYQPSTQERVWLSDYVNDVDALQLKQGEGCTYCHNTGFQGRIGIFELLELDEDMFRALRSDSANEFFASTKGKTKTLLASALEQAAMGVTTLSEVYRVAGEMV